MKTSKLLSPKRLDALERLIEKKGIAAKRVTIPRWNGDRSRAPLSFAQYRLWLIDQMHPGNAAYNMPSAYRLSGALHVSALERSLNEVVQRHESLRTTFQTVDGTPVQVVAATLSLPLLCVDLQGLSQAEQERTIIQLATQEAQTPFDLASGPLLRCKLLQLDAQEYILLLNMHHIISDGWSVNVLARETLILYTAFRQGQPSPLPMPSIQYIDFTVWQRAWLQGEQVEKLQAYWRQRLANMPVLELPTDCPRPEIASHKGDTRSIQFSVAQTEMLKAFSRDSGASLFMILLAGFLTLLARYSGQLDITIRSPVANRTRQQTEAIIGYFVNILALRTDLSGNPTFRELVQRVSNVCHEAYAHQELPFEQVLDDLRPMHRGRGPLFPVMFVLQNISAAMPTVPGTTFRPLILKNSLALFDLSIDMAEDGANLYGYFNYNTDVFEAATIQTMMEDFQAILESATLDSDQRLHTLGEKIPNEHIPALRPQPLATPAKQRTPAAPRTPVEETLVKIWQDVLGIAQIGVFDNFFELGGDSLQWMRVVSRVNQAGLKLALQPVSQSPTIAELAKAIHAIVPTVSETIGESESAATGFVPLSPNQCWFFEQNFIEPHHFNIVYFFAIDPPLRPDPALLKEALHNLLLRHEALRLRFAQNGSGWTQWIAPPDDDIPFSVVDLSALPEAERIPAMDKASEQAQTTLNLSDGPLLRVILFDCGSGATSYLSLTIHHLITDGFSNNILLEDFITSYQQLMQGGRIQLPAKTTSFKYWTEQLIEYTHSATVQQELGYWQSKPGEALPAILPRDHPNTSLLFKSLYRIAGNLDAETTGRLEQTILKAYDMQWIEVMLAVMAEAIGQAKAERPLYVDVLRHGRDLPLEGVDLSRTLGWCVIHFPLLLKLEGAQSLEEALPLVKEQYRRPIHGGASYDLLRYMNGDKAIKKTLRPRPEIVFSHESRQAATPFDGNQSLIRPIYRPLWDAKNPELVWPYLLELRTTLIGDELHWEWVSGETVYRRSTIEQLSQNFGKILKNLCSERMR